MARPQPNGHDMGVPPFGLEEMQKKLNQSARVRDPSRPMSPYNSVDALLLQWEEDDLKVDDEVTELDRIFTTRCNFTTQRWKIPSIYPEDQLIHRILDFRKGKTADDLLILFYGGHAGGDPQECIWAANKTKESPELNWHNVQNTLLGCPADVLLILDCCFATLAARNNGVGANWFLGASAKESLATGVSRDSFTSALTREIDRCAHLYWTRSVTFTVQSIHHGLVLWDRDLVYTPNLLRLTDHECHPTELTPLLHHRKRPQIQSTTTDPPEQTVPYPTSPPLQLRTSFTMPSNNASNHASDRSPSQPLGSHHRVFELSQGETQTLRVTGLPLSAGSVDVILWFENRLNRGSLVSKIGPLTESPLKRGTKETAITFSSLALAKQAATIKDLDFQAEAGSYPRNITIDDHFNGLTCVFSSTKAPDKHPSVDIVLVHGAYGHPINSFACHYNNPTSEFIWPCDAFAKDLEGVGIYPRIMTFGWDADAWLDPSKGIPHACDDLVQALKERSPKFQRPLFFVGHGVGGLLVKQTVNEIINFSFSVQQFQNPVKGCFFFAVPNQAKGIDDGYARMLANMRSALREGGRPDENLIRALRPRNRAVASVSEEFDTIRQEYDIKCLTFNGNRKTAGCTIVPSNQSTLTDGSDAAYHFDVDYRDVMRLPKGERDLEAVLSTLCVVMLKKLGLSIPSNGHLHPEAQSEPNQPESSQATFKARPLDKEKVYGKLKRYDTAFLVDDSDSMFGGRWETAKKVLADIAAIAVKYDRNGVDIRCFNADLDDDERLNLNSAEKVMKLFDNVEPEGPTPTADVLEIELKNYIFKYRRNRNTKSLNLIVLTDGEPDSDQRVADVIAKYAKLLEELEAPPLQVGIQFVQIGGDKAASEFLRSLDDDLQEKYKLDRDVSILSQVHVLRIELMACRWSTRCRGWQAMRLGCMRRSSLVVS